MASTLLVLAVALLAGPAATHPISKRSLYEHTDPVTILNATNFGPTVLGKETTWVVEFYKSWCGYCKRFAPIYKDFAKDVYGWSNVVRVGVVECSNDFNTQLCQHYEIKSVPTTKFFKPRLQWTDMGEEEQNTYNRTAVRYQVLDFLERTIATGQVPEYWPQLRRFSLSELGPLKNTLASNTEFFVVLEPAGEDVYIGRDVVMGSTSSPRKLKVVRMAYDVQEHGNLVSSSELPALVRVEDGGKLSVIERGSMQNPSESVNKLVRYLGGTIYDENINPPITTTEPPEDDNDIRNIPRDRVHLQDLEKALTYSLRQEVGGHQVLEGDTLEAFKNYLDVLIKYFPARPPVKSMLEKIQTWTDKQGNSVNVEDYQSFIQKSTSPQSLLPNHQKWKACRGSKSGYRGFPCGLWSTFHTLTVRAYDDDEGRDDGPKIVSTIRHFVEHFFSCRKCAHNFVHETEEADAIVTDRKGAVLYLWEIHNLVNKRVAGDLTEDPEFPKIQFPSYDQCPTCNTTGAWDGEAVFGFLQDFYRSDLAEASQEQFISSSTGRFELLPGFLYVFLGLLFI